MATILVRLLNFGATKGISQIFCKKKQLIFISQKIKDWLELPNSIKFQEKMEQSNVYKIFIEKNANLKMASSAYCYLREKSAEGHSKYAKRINVPLWKYTWGCNLIQQETMSWVKDWNKTLKPFIILEWEHVLSQ